MPNDMLLDVSGATGGEGNAEAGASDEAGKAAAGAEGTEGTEGTAEGKAGEGTDGAEGAEGAQGKDGEANDGEGEGAEGAEEDGEEGKDGDEADDADANELTGAPENYEDFTIPENLSSDEEGIATFVDEIAKPLNLSQKGGQLLIDKFGEAIGKFQQAQADAWANVQSEWRKSAETDKVIGGKNLKATLAHAKTALNEFGNPEFVKLVTTYGLGNNPHVLTVLSNIGKAVSEGAFHSGGNAQGGQKTLGQKLYPSHYQEK